MGSVAVALLGGPGPPALLVSGRASWVGASGLGSVGALRGLAPFGLCVPSPFAGGPGRTLPGGSRFALGRSRPLAPVRVACPVACLAGGSWLAGSWGGLLLFIFFNSG